MCLRKLPLLDQFLRQQIGLGVRFDDRSQNCRQRHFCSKKVCCRSRCLFRCGHLSFPCGLRVEVLRLYSTRGRLPWRRTRSGCPLTPTKRRAQDDVRDTALDELLALQLINPAQHAHSLPMLPMHGQGWASPDSLPATLARTVLGDGLLSEADLVALSALGAHARIVSDAAARVAGNAHELAFTIGAACGGRQHCFDAEVRLSSLATGRSRPLIPKILMSGVYC